MLPPAFLLVAIPGILLAVGDGLAGSEGAVHLIAEYGGLGVVLAWLMFRVERRMDKQVQSDDRKTAALRDMAESLMISVLAMKNLDGNVSELAMKVKDSIARNREDP